MTTTPRPPSVEVRVLDPTPEDLATNSVRVQVTERGRLAAIGAQSGSYRGPVSSVLHDSIARAAQRDAEVAEVRAVFGVPDLWAEGCRCLLIRPATYGLRPDYLETDGCPIHLGPDEAMPQLWEGDQA